MSDKYFSILIAGQGSAINLSANGWRLGVIDTKENKFIANDRFDARCPFASRAQLIEYLETIIFTLK